MVLFLFSNMNSIVTGLICLFTLCHCKVILISNEGNNSDCCLSGWCLCNSFIDALKHLEDNTTVNITSQLVTLDSNVTMGSGTSSLNNITILGNGATVICNNKGIVWLVGLAVMSSLRESHGIDVQILSLHKE